MGDIMSGKIIYVCTVGTGTAGKFSNVAAGIISAVKERKPSFCCLLPSQHENSIAVAEIVKEGIAAICESEVHPLSDFDDLLLCRKEIRNCLKTIINEKNGEIFLNPTSGTKQMTTAAVFAAIDEKIENIEYITGERADGVVKTGTEKITKISCRDVYARISFDNAAHLLKSGAYQGAEKILEKYSDFFPVTYSLAKILGFWDRFGYENALREASRNAKEDFSAIRKVLDKLKNSDKVSLERAADMMNFSRRSLDYGNVEEALAVMYRVVELLAKLKLSKYGINENSTVKDITIQFDISLELQDKLARQIEKNKDKILLLGMAQAFEILECHHNDRFSFLENVFYNNKLRIGNKGIWDIVQLRQKTRYGHGNKFISADKVEQLYKAVFESVLKEWPDFTVLCDRFKFPRLDDFIKKESNNA